MAWKMIGEPKTRKCTRSLAEEYSGMTPAPHDRALNSTRSAILKKAFDMGLFRTCEWAAAYCHETKLRYRINGKHTSTLLAQMNGSLPKNLSVIVEEYECDTLQDVASLYATFDTRASVRSTHDINRIFAATVPELEDVSAKVINTTIVGIAYANYEEDYKRQSAEARAVAIIDNSEFCLWLRDLTEGYPNERQFSLLRGSVSAAMFKCWQKSKSQATEFWSAVRDESGVRPDSPDRKLSKFLTMSRIASRGQSNQRIACGTREMYVKCLHAWNAWRSNSTTDLKFYPAAKTPAAK